MKEFYYFEWKLAEAEGRSGYAQACKEQYRALVMSSLKRCYIQRSEKLRAYPPIHLN